MEENIQPVNNLTPEQEAERQAAIEMDQKRVEEQKRFQQIVIALQKSIFIIFKQAFAKVASRIDIDRKKGDKYTPQTQIIALTMWNELSLNMFFETLKEYYPPQAKEYGINLLNHKLAKHGVILLEVKQPDKQEDNTPDNKTEAKNESGDGNTGAAEQPESIPGSVVSGDAGNIGTDGPVGSGTGNETGVDTTIKEVSF